VDNVSVDGTILGALTGSDDTWNETSFIIPRSMLYDDGQLNVWLDIDTTMDSWYVTIDWSKLTTHWDWADPIGNSADNTGANKDEFQTGEPVYATGTGFPGETDIDIYVVKDTQWIPGMVIPPDVSGDGVETVHSNEDGSFGPIEIWSSPHQGRYDIIFDINQNGQYTYYASGGYYDAVDDLNTTGFVVLTGPVGGRILPVNTFSLLAPYLLIAVTFITTIAILYLRKIH
jgi:hypothetical protein